MDYTDYTTTADFKDKVPLTEDEKRQVINYIKSQFGKEISPNEIIQNIEKCD